MRLNNVNQRESIFQLYMPLKYYLVLFPVHTLIISLWYIDFNFLSSGFSNFLLIIFSVFYLIQGFLFFRREHSFSSFLLVLLPCSTIFLWLAFSVYVDVFGSHPLREKMISINLANLRTQYQLRKREFRRDIDREKNMDPSIRAIQWLPMSGGSGPLFIYSEIELPTNQYVRHKTYTWNMPRGARYAIEKNPTLEGEKAEDTNELNDCLGYMRALDTNFYVFLNGDCY
ncbi:hypothetical protein [Herbaspirillum huttiense]|uniref:hypothetical protein n=1 Tax=Herbaspirillum huttiense TaxID=863372 RepID=UPI002176C247|nr:hypothetical protein [Herbaspirillum huttiense]UWE16100.1 hypothetical protein NY669_23960 [Herbaspirillum huttiense]